MNTVGVVAVGGAWAVAVMALLYLALRRQVRQMEPVRVRARWRQPVDAGEDLPVNRH